jgi:hypothetical protein
VRPRNGSLAFSESIWRLNDTLTGASGVPTSAGYPGDVGRRTWVVLAVVAVLVAGGVVLAGLALGGGSDPSTAEEYQAAAVLARDRTDFAMGRLSGARTFDELLVRMDEASAAIDDAADALDEKTPPEVLEDEHDRLVSQMNVLAGDIASTAEQAREPGFEDIFQGAQGLSFDSWDEINAVFVKMKAAGVVVPPLSRHTTS